MKITIQGNIKPYQLTNSVENLELSLEGDFSFTAKTRIRFNYGSRHFSFNNRNDLFQFTEKTKGASLDRIVLALMDTEVENEFIKELAHKSEIEIGLLKALFLIYNWVELPMTDPATLQLKSRIYDDFVIDYSGKPEIQKDIYFIKEKNVMENNQKYIDKLQDLNLLAKTIIDTNSEQYETYFIPLIKVGVSKSNFKSDFDSDGSKTYKFWSKILNQRDKRIKYWITNRY
ncbi:hypothetical protein KUL113_47980 [Tenacibaculum sp. KUL113]|nr:hypothetical protein KUL113_47980 [Tenacibaculum sp. KUL113]